ncbi:MAG: amidase [Actinomycetota bacterium]
MRPADLSVPELAAAIAGRTISAREAVLDTLGAIDAHDDVLNAVVAIDHEGALATADAIDQQVVEGAPLPPYAGVPMLVKDLSNARGLPTTFGTASMASFQPPFDDHTVTRMRDAGFVVVGKTNVPELGSLPWTESTLHGPARNPWAPDRTPGGSSGGAAAAVAAGYLAAAHGSDGGGSLRIPAACCGVVGLKPSRGRVSHAPLFGDQVMGYSTQGSIGRRVVDAAALLDVMQGYAPGDPYHLPSPSQPFVDEVGADPGRLRVGLLDRVPWALPDADVADAVSSTAARLASLGHVVEPVRVAIPSDVPERFTRVWAASLAANPIPHDLLEPHNRAFAAAGEAMSAPALLRDFTSLQLLARSVVAAFEAHDVVLAPVTTRTALRVGELGGLSHAGMLAEIASWIGICPLVNVTGQPAISLPVHRDGAGVPVGVQLIGHPADEATLVRLAAQLEQVIDWADHRPDPDRWVLPEIP